MPVTFAEDPTAEEAKAGEARVTPDEKDGSARWNRDTPLARWASTPSFLTGSLSTNNTPSTPRSPTEVTTEQPRPTTFDSVPSIPSDLF